MIDGIINMSSLCGPRQMEPTGIIKHMIIKSVELETVIGVSTKNIPVTGQPEIVMAGRSNVGKSSLINVLMNRKKLARISETPGKTQTINFYHVNKSFYLVDLPGYGYAKVSMDFRAAWGPMIEKYFRKSEDLRAVFLLLDIRRIPSKDDLMMYEWMRSSGLTPTIIVTKSDKLKPSKRQEAIDTIKATLPESGELQFFLFSALKKEGRDTILDRIEELVLPDKASDGALQLEGQGAE